MGRRPGNASGLLRQTRNVLVGVVIGNAVAAPALAATEIAIGDFSKPILVGSLALLVIGLALKVKRGKTERPAQSAGPTGFSEGIGRYRLHFGRGETA